MQGQAADLGFEHRMKGGVIMLSAVARLTVVASLLIFLGIISIIMGFSPSWPDAQSCGAVFFVGGWLLVGLVSVASQLERIAAILSEKREQ